MIKSLDADWLRGVHLFHYLYCNTIENFPKINKMVESYLHTKLNSLRETKGQKYWQKYEVLDESLVGLCFDKGLLYSFKIMSQNDEVFKSKYKHFNRVPRIITDLLV